MVCTSQKIRFHYPELNIPRKYVFSGKKTASSGKKMSKWFPLARKYFSDKTDCP